MKKLVRMFFGMLLVIVLAVAGIGGFFLYQKYLPSKEEADLEELFGCSGNDVALVLNEEIQETKGLYIEGQTYLPITWVNKYLNERFYWDSNEKLLVYTLPDMITYANASTKGSADKPLLYERDDDVYLALGLVVNYTDIRIESFDGEEIKRVYIWNTWKPEQTASLKKDGKLRTKGGIKSPIVQNVLQGCKVKILKSMEKWSYVQTETGFLGYIENRKLTEAVEEVPKSSFTAPVYQSTSMDERVCLVWHQVTAPIANEKFDSLIAETKGVNVVSPTWFALTDNEGNFNSLASKEYVKKAHELGIQVWALLDNFSKDVQTEVLLAKTSTRKKLIAALMEKVHEYDLDGLNLDFESLKKSAGPHYIQFIRELSVSCRKEGIILSVDNYVPAAHTEFYNRKEQGIVADYVIIMGYDEHYAGGEMGSVASLPYVKKGIQDTLAVVPKEKLINGVPFYTRLWKVTGDETKSSALGISAAKAWIEENEVELSWDSELGQYYGELLGEETNQYIWLEEERSLKLKKDLIDHYDLAGVACWKLGLESEDVWDVMNNEK
ncbi:glycosyl hydrolase family 18 protein [Lachnospiraceae bacterium 62-35]